MEKKFRMASGNRLALAAMAISLLSGCQLVLNPDAFPPPGSFDAGRDGGRADAGGGDAGPSDGGEDDAGCMPFCVGEPCGIPTAVTCGALCTVGSGCLVPGFTMSNVKIDLVGPQLDPPASDAGGSDAGASDAGSVDAGPTHSARWNLSTAAEVEVVGPTYRVTGLKVTP